MSKSLAAMAEDSVQTEKFTVVRPPSGGTNSMPTTGRVAQLDAPNSDVTRSTRGPCPASGKVQELIDTGGKGSAGSRSGYAVDKYPQLVDGDEALGKAVPIASEKGAQAGRIPPAKRHGGVHYEAVTADVAVARAQQRAAGILPPIASGADDHDSAYTDRRMELNDDPGAGTAQIAPAKLTTATAALYTKLTEAINALSSPVNPAPCENSDQCRSSVAVYLQHRGRVNFRLENGTYSVPAIDVRESPLGIIIVLPYGAQDAIFTPNPGTKVCIGWKGQSWDCYFPGTSFEIPDLGVLVITMIRSDEG
jgi:hypothetical protein